MFNQIQYLLVRATLALLLGTWATTGNAQASCDFSFKKKKICGELSWVTPPKKVEMITEKDKAEFNLRFYKQGNSKMITDPEGTVSVKLFMPSMGHGSRPTKVESETGLSTQEPVKGKYVVKDVYFTMPGDWEIQIELIKNGKILDRAVMPFQL